MCESGNLADLRPPNTRTRNGLSEALCVFGADFGLRRRELEVVFRNELLESLLNAEHVGDRARVEEDTVVEVVDDVGETFPTSSITFTNYHGAVLLPFAMTCFSKRHVGVQQAITGTLFA